MQKLSHSYAFILGIDVSKESLDVCLIRLADGQLFHLKINNNMQGFQKMKTWLKSHGCELEADILVCLEHTGLYTRRLVHYLLSRQVHVWLESSLQIKRSIGLQRGIDAQRIAKYALLHSDQANLVNLSVHTNTNSVNKVKLQFCPNSPAKDSWGDFLTTHVANPTW